MKELVRGADPLPALQGVQRLGGVMNGMRGKYVQQASDTGERGQRLLHLPRFSGAVVRFQSSQEGV